VDSVTANWQVRFCLNALIARSVMDAQGLEPDGFRARFAEAEGPVVRRNTPSYAPDFEFSSKY